MTANYTPVHNISDQITVLNNHFIDDILPKADGEYVKIYLMLVRLQTAGEPVSVEILADRLELTQKDIQRALSYWVREGVLQREAVPGAGSSEDFFSGGCPSEDAYSEKSSSGNLSRIPSGSEAQARPAAAAEEKSQPAAARERRETAPPISPFITVRPSAIPVKLSHSPEDLAQYREDSDLSRTVYMAEIYLGKPLSVTDLETLCYISEQLAFSPDLMDYLIEYCVDRGKKSIRYIEKVAIGWFEKGISTVEDARIESRSFAENVYPVMKAFGLSGRNPGPSELDFIESWNRMGLGTSLIIEACSRTLLAINQPSFRYANRILEEWKRQGVRSMEDVKRLDQQHMTSVQSRKETLPEGGLPGRAGSARPASNSFHNFNQRQYNYSSLESALAETNRRSR